MQAKTGGQSGMNGEWYKGGQFLPSTTLPKQAQRKVKRGSGKQETAPYIWKVPPEGMTSLYAMIQTFCRVNTDGTLSPLQSQQPFDYYGVDKEQVTMLAEQWSDGETWIDESETIWN